MRKYQALFLEEATEHLAEMSRALLELEKDPGADSPLEVIFRMAHSVKSMAASLGYDAISELSHRLEDRMERIRQVGRVSDGDGGDDLALLFRGLDALERMVEHVRQSGEGPPAEPELCAALATAAPATPKKKLLNLP